MRLDALAQGGGHAAAQRAHGANVLRELGGTAMGGVQHLLGLHLGLRHHHLGFLHRGALEVLAQRLGRNQRVLKEFFVLGELVYPALEGARAVGELVALAQQRLVVLGEQLEEALDLHRVEPAPAAREAVVLDVERRESHGAGSPRWGCRRGPTVARLDVTSPAAP